MAADFDVKTAGSAAEALAILAEHAGEIAIVVSDQRMPEKTGVELLKEVREYYPEIVRLLTTAYTDLEDAIEAINRGEILRYIQKPWDLNTLKSELKHALNYFHLRSERDALLKEKLSVRQSTRTGQVTSTVSADSTASATIRNEPSRATPAPGPM